VKDFTMADPNTHTTPSTAPVPSCKDTACTTRHRCVCNWEDCADFQRKIQALADPSHLWKSGLVQIRNRPDSLKSIALRSSIVHHLRPTDKDQSKDSFFVAPHHWSVSLLQAMTGRPCLATPLTAEQAKQYNEQEGHCRHQEDANKINTILHRCAPQSNVVEAGYKPIPSRYEFVKAPVSTKADVLSFIKSLESGRSARTEKRQESAAQVVTLPKKARVESTTEPPNATATATPVVDRSPAESFLTPDLWPSYDKCLRILTDRYNKIAIEENDLDKFSQRKSVRCSLFIISDERNRDGAETREPVLRFPDGKHLFLCVHRVNDKCLGYALRSRIHGIEPPCVACAAAVEANKRMKDRQEAAMRKNRPYKDPDSCVAHTHLSPEAQTLRLKQLSHDNKVKSQTIRYLRCKVAKLEGKTDKDEQNVDL
jgi:hypothetical protein